jgi:hypothetical protein
MLRKYIAFLLHVFSFPKTSVFYTTFLTVYTHVHFLILTVQRSFAVFTFTSQEFNLHILFSFFPGVMSAMLLIIIIWGVGSTEFVRSSGQTMN